MTEADTVAASLRLDRMHWIKRDTGEYELLAKGEGAKIAFPSINYRLDYGQGHEILEPLEGGDPLPSISIVIHATD